MVKTLMVLLVVLTNLNDQYFNTDEQAVIYYTPQNSIVFNFTYTVETHEVGKYALFANELLGATDIVKETRTIYELKNVSIGSRSEVDLLRPHKVVAEPGTPIHYLNINEKGLLVGFNLPPQQKKTQKKKQSEELNHIIDIDVPPFTTDIVDSKTLQAEAESVANQIFHIRDIRMYLLSGELEHAPADGEAMQHVLDELEKQEKALTALFVGTKRIETKSSKYEYTPAGRGNAGKLYHKHFYFSLENGFTDEENIDAEKIEIRAEYQHQRLQESQEEKKSRKQKNISEPSQIVYNIPGYAHITVRYRGKLICKKTLPIAQFGIDMPFSKCLFMDSELPQIIFSEKTGNIISISK